MISDHFQRMYHSNTQSNLLRDFHKMGFFLAYFLISMRLQPQDRPTTSHDPQIREKFNAICIFSRTSHQTTNSLFEVTLKPDYLDTPKLGNAYSAKGSLPSPAQVSLKITWMHFPVNYQHLINNVVTVVVTGECCRFIDMWYQLQNDILLIISVFAANLAYT